MKRAEATVEATSDSFFIFSHFTICTGFFLMNTTQGPVAPPVRSNQKKKKKKEKPGLKRFKATALRLFKTLFSTVPWNFDGKFPFFFYLCYLIVLGWKNINCEGETHLIWARKQITGNNAWNFPFHFRLPNLLQI